MDVQWNTSNYWTVNNPVYPWPDTTGPAWGPTCQPEDQVGGLQGGGCCPLPRHRVPSAYYNKLGEMGK